MPIKAPHLNRFYVLTAAVVGAAAFWLGYSAVQSGPSAAPDWMIVGLFAALVTASENLSLVLPSRITLSPQLILVMAAVSALDGRGVVLGTLIIGGAGSLVVRSFRIRRYLPILFNLGQMALSAGTAAIVFGTLSGTGTSPVLTYAATVLSYTAVNFGLVVAGATLRSGSPLHSLWTDMRVSALNDFVFGILGLLLGKLYLGVGPVALVVVIAPTVAARTVFISAVKFRQTYRRLELLYSFTRQIERSSDYPDIVSAVLAQFRSLLDVHVAEFAALGPTGWRRTSLSTESRAARHPRGAGVGSTGRSGGERPGSHRRRTGGDPGSAGRRGANHGDDHAAPRRRPPHRGHHGGRPRPRPPVQR